MEQAAILAYAVPKARPEHSVIYESKNWNELVTLLECPVEFLRMKGTINSAVSWSLLQHSTIIVEPIGNSRQQAIRDAMLLEWGGPRRLDGNLDEMIDEALRYLNGNESLTPKDGPNDEQYFRVEFATYTRILWIKYRYVPSCATSRHSKPRFCGTILPITHVSAQMKGKFGVGNIHFDIKNELGLTERHRASLIVDYIEDSSRLINVLNGPKRKLKTYKGRCKFKPVMKPTTSQEIIRPSKPEIDSSTRIFAENIQPRIVVEGASVPELPEGYTVCIDGDIRIVDKEIFIGDILVKLYAPSPQS